MFRPGVTKPFFSYERNKILSFPQQRYKRNVMDLGEVKAPVPCTCISFDPIEIQEKR